MANGLHKTKVIKLGAGTVVYFPLKERYDQSNRSLSGVEAAHHARVNSVGQEPIRDESREVVATWGASTDEPLEQPPPTHGPTHMQDSLGRFYQLDPFGNLKRKTNKPRGRLRRQLATFALEKRTG